MKYLTGLDGGGTKTRCVITNFNFEPLYTCQGGASNFLIVGTEKVSEIILSLIIESIEALKISPEDVASILIGTTGAGRTSDAQKLRNDFLKYSESNGYSFNSFQVESDARIALEGAFSGGPGILLIAGTGSIAFAKDKSDIVHRVGGYGRLIGDEGSGNTIGRSGLNEVAKELDGRGSKTLMTQMLKDNFGIYDTQQLVTEVYRNNFDLASFAPKVFEAAQKGDKPALKILEHESDELISHLKAIAKKLDAEKIKLCLVGGTIATDNFYSSLLREKIKQQMPNVTVTPAEYPPEIGAVIMAKTFVEKNSE
ncbi:MAG: BadF/BadG/BcrA/BcrD ATPase family protein [Bacteroidota bacterium]